MPRHHLTKEDQEKGVEAALESPRTPPQLKRGLRKRQEQLAASDSGETRSTPGRSPSGRSGRSRSTSSQTTTPRASKRTSRGHK